MKVMMVMMMMMMMMMVMMIVIINPGNYNDDNGDSWGVKGPERSVKTSIWTKMLINLELHAKGGCPGSKTFPIKVRHSKMHFSPTYRKRNENQ